MAAPADAQVRTVKLSAGLEAQITLVGRCKSYVTVAMTIANKGPASVHVALVTPAPLAVDNSGTKYQYNTHSGLSKCPSWSSVEQCIGVPQTYPSVTLPTQAYTVIDPGTQVTAGFELFGQPSEGPLIAFSANLLYRVVSDRLLEDKMTETQKRQQVRVMPLSFANSPVAQSEHRQ
jgi:hypothetical protein